MLRVFSFLLHVLQAHVRCLAGISKCGESIKHIYLGMTLLSVLEKLSGASLLGGMLQLTDGCKFCLGSGTIEKFWSPAVELLGRESLHMQAKCPS